MPHQLIAEKQDDGLTAVRSSSEPFLLVLPPTKRAYHQEKHSHLSPSESAISVQFYNRYAPGERHRPPKLPYSGREDNDRRLTGSVKGLSYGQSQSQSQSQTAPVAQPRLLIAGRGIFRMRRTRQRYIVPIWVPLLRSSCRPARFHGAAIAHTPCISTPRTASHQSQLRAWISLATP